MIWQERKIGERYGGRKARKEGEGISMSVEVKEGKQGRGGKEGDWVNRYPRRR